MIMSRPDIVWNADDSITRLALRYSRKAALYVLIIAPVLLFIWFTTLGVRRKAAVVVALIATLVIWYAFYKVLRVPLPWGLLTGIAF